MFREPKAESCVGVRDDPGLGGSGANSEAFRAGGLIRPSSWQVMNLLNKVKQVQAPHQDAPGSCVHPSQKGSLVSTLWHIRDLGED